jgi:hypothetical protein
VVTGAADRIPERISRLVYLDSRPLPDGSVLIEAFPSELRRHIERQVEELGEGWRFPMPSWKEVANMASLEGVDEDHLKLLRFRAVAQPFGTYTQPLRLGEPCPRRATQVRDPVQFLAGPGARDDRQRQPLVSRTRRTQVAVRRATHGTLAHVL